MEMPQGAEIVQPVSTVDALVQMLRNQILEGALPAGTPLREAEISSNYKVSRHTVRSALQALVHDGIARHAPNRGTFVPDFQPEEIVEMFQLRQILEFEAVRQLVEGTADLAGPRAALAALQALPPDADWRAVRDGDLAIHKALVNSLGNERISRTAESLMSELRLSLLHHLKQEFEQLAWVVGQHEDLLEALEQGDRERAERWIENHNNESITDLIESLANRPVAPKS